MEACFMAVLFIVGAVFGSFLCCQAWRLHYREEGNRKFGKWSVCLSCGKKIQWYDNVPIFSWLLLRGKCRKCGAKIGVMEILSEVLVGLAFAGAGYTMLDGFSAHSGVEWVGFALVLLFIINLGFLAIYDGKWGELPVPFLVSLIIIGAGVRVLNGVDLANNLGAIGVLAGTYLVLYLISKGKLVGDGDWVICLGLALVLGDAWLALITLFLANMIGSIVMLPLYVKKKQKKVYFGPFLAIAFMLAYSFSVCFFKLLML